jgi:hypothetical protein
VPPTRIRPAAFAADKKIEEHSAAKPLSDNDAKILATMGIRPVDAGRLEHALAYVAPLAVRQKSDWREPTHHATEAAEMLRSWKPGDSVDRLAAAAAHLIGALAKSGVQSDMVENDEDESDE